MNTLPELARSTFVSQPGQPCSLALRIGLRLAAQVPRHVAAVAAHVVGIQGFQPEREAGEPGPDELPELRHVQHYRPCNRASGTSTAISPSGTFSWRRTSGSVTGRPETMRVPASVRQSVGQVSPSGQPVPSALTLLIIVIFFGMSEPVPSSDLAGRPQCPPASRF